MTTTAAIQMLRYESCCAQNPAITSPGLTYTSMDEVVRHPWTCSNSLRGTNRLQYTRVHGSDADATESSSSLELLRAYCRMERTLNQGNARVRLLSSNHNNRAGLQRCTAICISSQASVGRPAPEVNRTGCRACLAIRSPLHSELSYRTTRGSLQLGLRIIGCQCIMQCATCSTLKQDGNEDGYGRFNLTSAQGDGEPTVLVEYKKDLTTSVSRENPACCVGAWPWRRFGGSLLACRD